MNFTELKQLESLGIVLPTPAYLVGSILFGIIGWIARAGHVVIVNRQLKTRPSPLIASHYLLSAVWRLS